MAIVYLSLGSNVGDKKEMLKKALVKLENNDIKITHQSPLYETEPWGEKNQEWFLNQVVKANTHLDPEFLFETIKKIEKELGRKTRKRWMEREIDIDILFYDEVIFETDTLIIPHPRITERRFILMPLCDINPEFVHPENNKTIKVLLDECNDRCVVKNKKLH